jgi:hypothetical protein
MAEPTPLGHPIAPPTPPAPRAMDKDRIVIDPSSPVNPPKIDTTEEALKKIRRDALNLDEPSL